MTAQIKGFRTPDLYDTGTMQETLQIEAKNVNEYIITPTVDYGQKLFEKYDDVFGIAISMQSQAKAITSKAPGLQYQQP